MSYEVKDLSRASFVQANKTSVGSVNESVDKQQELSSAFATGPDDCQIKYQIIKEQEIRESSDDD
jgi:hypothetical protein